MATIPVITIHNHKHGGVWIGPGCRIEIEEEQGLSLLKRGLVKPVSERDSKTRPVKQKPENANAVTTALVSAIGKLDRDDSELWARGGRPRPEALADQVGYPVTAIERDAAWAAHKHQEKKSDDGDLGRSAEP